MKDAYVLVASQFRDENTQDLWPQVWVGSVWDGDKIAIPAVDLIEALTGGYVMGDEWEIHVWKRP